ncbi:MAG: DMT family transporter [Christensenellales bacterium]|nr:DMT family transporter [Christensenellales bacterium]
MKDNRVLTGSLCALGCEVLYGLSYLFTKQTAETASPLALLGWRFVVALAAMSLCVALGFISVRLKGRRLGPLLRVALFCPCLYFIGETVGIRETTVTESGVFLACVPALSLLASTVILKKKPTKRQIIGILVTFLGVMTTVVAVGLSSSLSPVGYAALMLAVVAYALYSVFVDLAADYTGAEITYVMLCSGAAFYGLLALGEAAAHGALSELLTLPARSGTFRTAVLYQGIGCSVAAFFLSNAAIAKIGVNKTSSFIGVSTIVSILAGALALGEPLSVGQIVGAAVIVAGVYTANKA